MGKFKIALIVLLVLVLIYVCMALCTNMPIKYPGLFPISKMPMVYRKFTGVDVQGPAIPGMPVNVGTAPGYIKKCADLCTTNKGDMWVVDKGGNCWVKNFLPDAGKASLGVRLF
jgi:hypothetical protein